ncbi:MAG: hypothetical protein KJ993_14580 [Actinobacteria bacterium]|nr:hypothetical protein [Actinomycetota bacterium]
MFRQLSPKYRVAFVLLLSIGLVLGTFVAISASAKPLTKKPYYQTGYDEEDDEPTDEEWDASYEGATDAGFEGSKEEYKQYQRDFTDAVNEEAGYPSSSSSDDASGWYLLIGAAIIVVIVVVRRAVKGGSSLPASDSPTSPPPPSPPANRNKTDAGKWQ